MISLDEAQRHVRSRLPEPVAATVPTGDSLGLVLAEDVVAARRVPPFTNSAMDGFAVRSADAVEPGAELAIAATTPAGAAPGAALLEGQAVRIMTGAPMPPGADAVVMIEKCAVADDGTSVRLDVAAPVGQHVRPAGDDIEIGDTVLSSGTVVSPAGIGVLLTLGIAEVHAWRRPRVGVVSTGDELVESDQPLGPGQIVDSNRPTLLALASWSGLDVVDLGHAPDDESAIEAVLRRGAAECDAVLSSGGVSMGDFDFVKVVLDRIADMRWMQVRIKPAKPFAFGVMSDGAREVPIFGLPGNPVSSVVSFELFARPSLLAMAGRSLCQRPRVQATATADFARRDDGKTHFVRASLVGNDDGSWEVGPVSGQGSHHLGSLARADALVILEPGEGVAAGATVTAMVCDR